MRVRTALLVGAVLLAGLGLAGAATAAPDGESDRALNESTNESGSGGVGICVTGVDSPCNGEAHDGDDEPVPVDGANGSSKETTGVGVGSGGSAGGTTGIDFTAFVRLLGSLAFGLA